jgi:hypothetical protein
VIVMRHANSPPTPPDPAQANADNVQHERQLDETGRSSARALGEALRQLHILSAKCSPAQGIGRSRRYRSRTLVKRRRSLNSGRAQRVVATLACSLAAGVLKPKVSRGR